MTPIATYEANLASSGKLKLKAKALLATGERDDVFEATVLLHEAAALERRATGSLVDAPIETKFAGLVEECACLVEGLDPTGAARTWSQLLQARAQLDSALAEAMLARVAPRYDSLLQSYARELARTKVLHRLFAAHAIVPTSPSERTAAIRDVEWMAAKFPGVSGLWWSRYRLAEAAEDAKNAWLALGRARRLDPENNRFHALSLLTAVWALDRDAAEQHVANVRGQLTTAGAEVCLMYALSELRLARTGRAPEQAARWQRARDAVRAGRDQEGPPELRKHLRATELLTDSLIHGKPPTTEILYLAGLTDIAARAQPPDDVLDLLTASVMPERQREAA